MSLQRVSRFFNPDSTVFIVGTVIDDVRLLTVPKMMACALHVTQAARKRILKANGKVTTFDHLAFKSPTIKNCLLLQGKRTARIACKHFEKSPGVYSHLRLYVRSKRRKFEGALGHCSSCAYKK